MARQAVAAIIPLDEKLRWPLSERDWRYRRARLAMALRGVDCLLVFGREEGDHFLSQIANVCYLTNTFTGGYLVFPMEGEPVAFIGGQNKYEPFNYFEGAQDWVREVRSQDTGIKGAGLEGAISTIREMGLDRSHIGLVDGNEKPNSSLPYKTYERLHQSLPNARFSDQTSILTEARLIKSPWEIGMLERAGECARAMIQALLETARAGVRECEVFSNMLKAQILSGGDAHTFIDLASGPVDEEVHLLHGKLPPYAPRQRILQKGDVVVVEFHSKYGGYLAAAEFTAAIGEPPRQYRRVHQVAVEALLRGTESIRVGVPFNVAVEALRKPVMDAGMDYVELGVHQHGLSSAGFPTAVYRDEEAKYLPLRRTDGSFANISSFELQEGMVFGHNIDIHDPSWRPNVGVMLGDTVVVTREGPKLLVKTPLELSVL